MPDLSTRFQHEAAIRDVISSVFDAHRARLNAGLTESEIHLRDDLERQLAIALLLIWMDSTSESAREARVSIDLAEAERLGRQWSRAAARQAASTVARNTIDALTYARTGAVSPPDLTDFTDELDAIFGPERAEGIAITETTRAATAATLELETVILDDDVKVETLWRTERDARVCRLCSPLNLTDQDIWGLRFPDGPPAHPRCRCWLQVIRRTLPRSMALSSVGMFLHNQARVPTWRNRGRGLILPP